MSQTLEKAYEVLYRSIQSEFFFSSITSVSTCCEDFTFSSLLVHIFILRFLGECRILSADYVEMKAVLCQSFAALQEREVLLKYALGWIISL